MCTLLTAFLLTLAAGGAAAAQTQLVIVSGLGGDPKYQAEFTALAAALAQAAHERSGLPDSAITWLGETPQPQSRWYRGASTRTGVQAVLQRLAAGPAGEQVVIVLIGHGSGEGAESRISLPGPDISAAEFGQLLDAFGQRRVAFINMTSGSGDMLKLLARPGRVVVTATKSSFERNESQFARYFVEAFSQDGADADKDDRVSLFEAFTYADAETRRFYEGQQRIATEHAQLADDGQLAKRFFLVATPASAARDPRIAALHAQRGRLEEQIAALRQRKDSLPGDAYETELERLLVALAETSAEIRRLEGGR